METDTLIVDALVKQLCADIADCRRDGLRVAAVAFNQWTHDLINKTLGQRGEITHVLGISVEIDNTLDNWETDVIVEAADG